VWLGQGSPPEVSDASRIPLSVATVNPRAHLRPRFHLKAVAGVAGSGFAPVGGRLLEERVGGPR
jgi:hypothetical protein